METGRYVKWLERELVCSPGMSQAHPCLGYTVNQEPMRFVNELNIGVERKRKAINDSGIKGQS